MCAGVVCRMAKRADLVGQRFGRLVVEEYAFTRKNAAFWKCKCDCGNYVNVPTYSLRCGNTKSCGCYRLEKQSETKEDSHKYSGLYTSKHRPRLYWTWLNMIRRCEDSKAPDYYRYGALGISVCEEWHDLPTFLEWANSHGWGEGLTIDRIDNSGNYCPENCRWADRYTQSNNKRNSVVLEFNSKKQTVANWARELNVSPNVLYSRIKAGWTIEDTLTKPVLNRIKKSN